MDADVPLVSMERFSQVRHDGSGDPDVGVMPVEEVFVLDVPAADVGCASVQNQQFPVVPVRGEAGDPTVQEEGGPVERVHLGAVIPERLQFPDVLLGIGRFVQDDAHVGPGGRLLPEDAREDGSDGIQTEPVRLDINGNLSLFHVIEQPVQVLLSFGDQGHGVPSGGFHVGVLLHQSGQLLILGTDSGIQRSVRYDGDIGLVQRGAVTAARQRKTAEQRRKGSLHNDYRYAFTAFTAHFWHRRASFAVMECSVSRSR